MKISEPLENSWHWNDLRFTLDPLIMLSKILSHYLKLNCVISYILFFVITSYVFVIAMEAENINIINLWFMQHQQDLLMSIPSFLYLFAFFFPKQKPVNVDRAWKFTWWSTPLRPPSCLVIEISVSILIDHGNKLPEFFFLFFFFFYFKNMLFSITVSQMKM